MLLYTVNIQNLIIVQLNSSFCKSKCDLSGFCSIYAALVSLTFIFVAFKQPEILQILILSF